MSQGGTLVTSVFYVHMRYEAHTKPAIRSIPEGPVSHLIQLQLTGLQDLISEVKSLVVASFSLIGESSDSM